MIHTDKRSNLYAPVQSTTPIINLQIIRNYDQTLRLGVEIKRTMKTKFHVVKYFCDCIFSQCVLPVG